MRETQAIIERVSRINAQIQHIELGIDPLFAQIKPGQSLLVRPKDSWEPYLREQWWPVNITNNKLIVERPAGIAYEPGRQIVNVLGPVGQPFRFRKTLRNVLLIAYDSPPTPLLMIIPALLSNSISVTLVLLGSTQRYSTRHLPAEVEVIRGSSDTELAWANQVMTIGWADQVFAVVGHKDEQGQFKQLWDLFGKLRNEIPKQYLFGVYQPTLPCGEGACDSCMIRSSEGYHLVCAEGPAFDLASMLL